MELLSLIIALAKSGLPFPDLKNKEEVTDWIIGNADEVAALVAYFASQTDVVSATEELDVFAATLEDPTTVEKIGDGELIKMLIENLPQILQLLTVLLPLFLNKDEDEQPIPDADQAD